MVSNPSYNHLIVKGFPSTRTAQGLLVPLRPYVEALFETDEAKLGALIADAEWSIVGRFLELLISSVETDETLDLQNAAYALTELKKASAVASTLQHLVA